MKLMVNGAWQGDVVPTPELDASAIAHLTIGRMSDHLWSRTAPSRKETARLVQLALGAFAPA